MSACRIAKFARRLGLVASSKYSDCRIPYQAATMNVQETKKANQNQLLRLNKLSSPGRIENEVDHHRDPLL
jgi:hypothetical protein